MNAADHIAHTRHCDRAMPVVETVRQDATGQAWVCAQCQGCGRTDLDARMVDVLLDCNRDESAPPRRGHTRRRTRGGIDVGRGTP